MQEKGDRTYETYGRKIYVFQEYMLRNGLDDNEYRRFFQYKSTTDTYYYAIVAFFRYLKIHEGISNEFYEENSKAKELKNAYDALVKALKLNEKEQAFPLSDEECEKLILLCNEKLNKPTDHEIIDGANNGVYTLYISSLITKLVLLYGTKNKDISEMQVDAYDQNLNKINIRGYSVHLPDGLSAQMRRYIRIRDMITQANPSNRRLFIDINPAQKLDNAKMFSSLKAITGNSKAMSVAKFAIIQMLKNYTPYNLVMDFTGCGNDVCGHCQELVDEENGIFQLSEKNKKLDSSHRQSILYDKL